MRAWPKTARRKKELEARIMASLHSRLSPSQSHSSGPGFFAILNPNTVAASGGIHFHHFWYGLIMVLAAGWLGISETPSPYRRIYAILFGLGAGLIADEVGLLLTFGNYFSEPTYLVFIAAVCVAGVAILMLGFRKNLRYDLLELKRHERIIYAGVVIAGLSTIAFAARLWIPGVAVAVVGIVIIVTGVVLSSRHR